MQVTNNSIILERKIMTYILLLLLSIGGFAQSPAKFTTRTGHVAVFSSSSIMDVEAHNYQMYSTLDRETGKTTFTALIKSFEFKLGLADRAFNNKRLSVVEKPKVFFEGTITNLDDISFDIAGTYPVKIEGTLHAWGFSRSITDTGEIQVAPNGDLKAHTDLSITIEQESLDKINELMRQHLPAVVNVDTDDLGISRNIDIAVDMTYKKPNE